MPGIALGLVGGVCLVLLLPPSPWLPVLGLPLALSAVLASGGWRPALAAVAGGLLAASALQGSLEQRLDPALERIDLVVTGTIDGLPEHDSRRRRFEFLPERATHAGDPVALPGRLRISWYEADTPPPRPGERWRLGLRLRAPHGFANPGGFDYARWLLRHGIGATGYVRTQPAPQRLDPAGVSIDGLRAELRDRLEPLLAGRRNAGLLLALSLGDRGAIGPGAWHTLVDTGTNHLMAISGLHIGLVALLGFGLGGLCWRLLGPLRGRMARPVFQALAALLLAGAYAAMAGFALPTLRALAMLWVALSALCLRRRLRSSSILAVAVIVVLVPDPLAVLDAGFWLSFAAVTAIVLVMAGRLARPRRIAGWLRLQLGLSLALAPLLLGLFRQASVVAPVANLLAVPWVSAVTVPADLAGVALAPVWPAAAGLLLAIADASLSGLWPLLEWLAALPYAQWRAPALPVPLLALAAVGTLVLLLPRGLPGKFGALLALLPVLLWQPPRPGPGSVWLDVLDVGQGLAAVVRTAGHTLVYDAGPRLSPRFDTGRAVVNPFLQAVGVARLDALVISHGDNDHAGGGASVQARFRPPIAWSSVPQQTAWDDRFCAPGTGWTWDEVHFRFLHPPRDGVWAGNDGSCVLRIEGRGGSILLPGDIERRAEQHLVATGAALQADVVVAPHHGSASSSSPAFVRAVRPTWVLYPVGYRNRWALPRPEVMQRWRPAGWARTDCGGALHLEVDAVRGVLAPEPWRRVGTRRRGGGCAGSGKSGNMRASEPPAVARPPASAGAAHGTPEIPRH